MNTIFIAYTFLVIAAIAILFLSVKYTFLTKILKLKEWGLVLCGMVVLSIGVSLINIGKDVNSKLTTEFKVPKDFYSDAEYMNDSVNLDDATLFNHLLLMRVDFPEVILCQAKIESAQYKSELFKRNNNLFGMKVSTSRATTAGFGRAGYKEYPNWRESVTDYVLWQLSHNVSKMTRSEYIQFLGKIYAEDPKYTSKIKDMLTKINFDKLKEYER